LPETGPTESFSEYCSYSKLLQKRCMPATYKALQAQKIG